MRTGYSLPSKVRRTSDRGGESSLGIIKGRIGSQESLEFDQSPEKIFWDICPQLNEFPEIRIEELTILPSVFWVCGMLAPLGEKQTTKASGKPDISVDNVWTFSIRSRDTDRISIRLLTENTYFRYNIHQLIDHPMTLGKNFRPQVRALLKSHGDLHDDGLYLATPLVIIDSRD